MSTCATRLWLTFGQFRRLNSASLRTDNTLTRADIGFGAAQSMIGYGMPVAIFFTTCQKLIV